MCGGPNENENMFRDNGIVENQSEKFINVAMRYEL